MKEGFQLLQTLCVRSLFMFCCFFSEVGLGVVGLCESLGSGRAVNTSGKPRKISPEWIRQREFTRPSAGVFRAFMIQQMRSFGTRRFFRIRTLFVSLWTDAALKKKKTQIRPHRSVGAGRASGSLAFELVNFAKTSPTRAPSKARRRP